MNSRVINRFSENLETGKSNEQMNQEIQTLLTYNLNKLGVSLNHINYIEVNDHLSALHKRIKTDQDERSTY